MPISKFTLQAQGQDFPHLLVYGPPGAGKKTRIMCILRELYGSGAEKLRVDHMNFTVSEGARMNQESVGGLMCWMMSEDSWGVNMLGVLG